MRPPMQSTRDRSWIQERDNLESSVLKETVNEIAERDLHAHWRTIKDAKIKPRNPSTKPPSLIEHHGLEALSDLVSAADVQNMKPDVELPGAQDSNRRAMLLDSLHKLHEQHPRVENSYQYLAHVDNIEDVKDGTGEWQVQISRGRRRRFRSREDAEDGLAKDLQPVEKPLTDAHGNEILPLVEAAKRVATAKEVKRIQKAVRRRRRSGEECYTDDEFESAHLEPPPEPDPEDKLAADKLLRCAAVDLALESDTEGVRECIPPSIEGLCDWMGLDSLKACSPKERELLQRELAKGLVVPISGSSLYVKKSPPRSPPSSTTTGSGSEGYIFVSRKTRTSSLC